MLVIVVCVVVNSGVGVGYPVGFVSVTVVSLGPQCLQTVTVVYQPEGTAVVVLDAVCGQTVVVTVVVRVVKPVGQMSTQVIVVVVVVIGEAVLEFV